MRKYYWLHLLLESVFRRANHRSVAPIVPFALHARSKMEPLRMRRGVTLLELIVALALLGVMAALVAPAMIAPERRAPDVAGVIRSARSMAIARAQPLVLRVSDAGEWSLRPLPPNDAEALAAGHVSSSDGPFALQLTPLGGCLPLTGLPPSLGGWDVASCIPARPRAATRGSGGRA